MSARIVLFHDDSEFIDALTKRLGSDVAWFTDPVKALSTLEASQSIGVLVTRLRFADQQPVGLSLARLVRTARPDVRIIFTGTAELKDLALGVGDFITEPVGPDHLGTLVERLTEDAGVPDPRG